MVEPLSDDTKNALRAQSGHDINPTAEEIAAKEAADKAAADKAAADTSTTTSTDTGDLPDIKLNDGTKDKSEDSELNKTVNKTLEGAGYTEEALTARLIKDDGISDEFIAELKEKIDPDFIDAHVGRLRAELELAKVKESGRLDDMKAQEQATKDMNNHIYDKVGGEDKFKILGKTLKEKLSAEELTAINVKLASGNKTVVDEAIEFAVKKYNDIRGMGGALMEGDAVGNVTESEHITKEEYRAAMRTDKYKNDPAHARKIDADRLKTRMEDSKRYGSGHYYGFHPQKGRYSL